MSILGFLFGDTRKKKTEQDAIPGEGTVEASTPSTPRSPESISRESATSANADEIVPFSHVNGLTPGSLTRRDVERLLGRPESSEKPKDVLILKYPRRGIAVLVGSNSVVDAIVVDSPFKGKSDNGLYIGQPETEARRILNEAYFVTTDLPNFTCYGNDEFGGEFQVWFKDAKLIRMRLDRPTGRRLTREKYRSRTSDFECERCNKVTHHSPLDDTDAGKLWVCDACGYKSIRIGD